MSQTNSILICKRPCAVRFAYLWMTDPLHHQKIIVNSVKWNDTINFELLPSHCFTHHWLLFTYLCSSVTICVVILLWLCQCDNIIHLAVSLASLLKKSVRHFSLCPIFLYQLLTQVLIIPFRKKVCSIKVFNYSFCTCDCCFLKNRL